MNKKPYKSKKAKCGMCLHYSNDQYNPFCKKGHNLKFPLIKNEHNCKDYKFIERREPSLADIFTKLEFDYCKECAFEFNDQCSGKSWIPFKNDPKCEFFRDKKLVCKNAEPMLQYGNMLRNNYCKLPPHLRHEGNNNWKTMCPNAHTHKAEKYKCYKKNG